MKRTTLLILTGCIIGLMLTACGKSDASSGVNSTASSQPASSSAEASISQPASQETSTASQAEQPTADLGAILTSLSEAAALGDTIEVTQLDLKAGGLNVDNIIGFAGAEASTSADNGGIVIVVQVKPGTAEDVKAEFEKFRDSRLDDRYAERANAMANTKEARIVVNGDLVMYGVSASGDWAALDTAIAAVTP